MDVVKMLSTEGLLSFMVSIATSVMLNSHTSDPAVVGILALVVFDYQLYPAEFYSGTCARSSSASASFSHWDLQKASELLLLKICICCMCCICQVNSCKFSASEVLYKGNIIC